MGNNHYFNYNGIISERADKVIDIHNRSFRFGDGLFESMLWENGDIPFLDYHIERLTKGMKILKLENSNLFDAFFIRQQVTQLVKRNNLQGPVRVRLNVFRDGGGLYSPETNKAAFLIEAEALNVLVNSYNSAGIIIDIFKDHKKPINDFSQIKSNNALLYVLAGIYRKSHGFDEVILLNENGLLCEASGSNVFIWYRDTLYTPALSEGCVDGVMRRVVMEVALENNIPVIEAQINPEILNEAEELFITNAVHGLQWVLGYKKKRFFNKLSKDLQLKIEQWKSDKLEAR